MSTADLRSPLIAKAVSYFVSVGWSPAHAAGLVANLWAESRLRPDAVGDGGQAYGIAQWHPDRQQRFAAIFGKSIVGSSVDEQLAFVHAELGSTEKAAGDALRACVTAAEAGACVSKKYERPADREGEAAKRAALAADIAGEQPAAPIEDHSTTYQPQENTMAGSPLDAIGAIAGAINPIAGLLVTAFSPFIKEKLTKEIDRHADTPGIGAQVSDILINKAIEITGKSDPLEAVAVARQDPAKIQAIEQSASEWLAQMAPVLDKLASIEQATWKAEEESRAAAADRGTKMQEAGPIEKNPTFIIAMIILGMVATVVFTVLWKDAIVRSFGVTDLAAFSSDMQAFVIGAIVGSALTAVIAFFFGTTRSSAAKDLTIGEFARRLPNGGTQ